jgi:hypothetical protein
VDIRTGAANTSDLCHPTLSVATASHSNGKLGALWFAEVPNTSC